jgi:hypothetical protein
MFRISPDEMVLFNIHLVLKQRRYNIGLLYYGIGLNSYHLIIRLRSAGKIFTLVGSVTLTNQYSHFMNIKGSLPTINYDDEEIDSVNISGPNIKEEPFNLTWSSWFIW